MGDVQSSPSSTNLGDIVSNEENDYNPYNIPKHNLANPSEFNPLIAMSGSPPMHLFKRCDFASLPIEKQAAYADGVIRGSYESEWMIEQLLRGVIGDSDQLINNSAIGAYAYVYLKTNDERYKTILDEWCEANASRVEMF